jgi:hypothetical protein
MARLIYAVALQLLATLASAEVPSPSTYHCTIIQAYSISDKGLIVPSEEFWQRSYAKDQLVIDREAGRAFHPFFGTTNYQERLYLDEGSSEWSLKLLGYSMALEPNSESGRNAVATLVQVFTYVEGPAKPFIAIENANLVTGTCE